MCSQEEGAIPHETEARKIHDTHLVLLFAVSSERSLGGLLVEPSLALGEDGLGFLAYSTD